MKKEKFFRSLFLLFFISFFVSSLVLVFDLLRPFELKMFDFLTKHFGKKGGENRICLILIDQRSLNEFAKQGITWPWPRQIYVPVIDFLSKADALFIDIIFSENSSYGVEDDRILAEAVEKAQNVYLPMVLSREIKEFNHQILEKISIKSYPLSLSEFNSVTFPIDELIFSSKGLGNVSIYPDEDGVYRRMPLFSKVDNYIVPSFVSSYFIKEGYLKHKDGHLMLNSVAIPLRNGAFLLKFSSDNRPFCEFSFIEIFNEAVNEMKEKGIDRDFFKGKAVFLGLTAAGLFDLKPSPVSSKTAGVFIHATAYENLLNRNFIIPLPKFVVFLGIMFFSFIIPASLLKHHSLKFNVLSLLSILFFLSFSVVTLFIFSYYLEAMPLLFSVVFTATVTLLYSYASEGRQRSYIKKVFSQYMDKKIVDYILEHPELVAPGGHREVVTVFFADIEGFTSISEKLSPEDTALMLHKVLNAMTEVVINNSGVIDKYIGDCIMAFWGYPVKSQDYASNACRTAIECIERLEEINRDFSEKGFPRINIRIGIHTGDAIVGNIGSDRLFNFTVIGDTVNIASRLESVNKFFKTRVIISEDTASKISEEFAKRPLGIITVKGKVEPIGIYELIGIKEKLPKKELEKLERFSEAYTLIMNKRWIEAKDRLTSLLNQFPEDYPTKFYLQLVEKLEKSDGLTEDWFIVKMETK